jgi:NADH-quinone oxidoreductase subunit D
VRQRILEIKNSIEIIRGGLKSIPGGKYTVDKCTNEKYAKGSAYSAVEGPRGRIGVWISSDGSSRPARVRFLSPSVASCVALGEALIGQTLGDLATIAMSLDISMSEVDK